MNVTLNTASALKVTLMIRFIMHLERSRALSLILGILKVSSEMKKNVFAFFLFTDKENLI